jgi:hypothetical protein
MPACLRRGGCPAHIRSSLTSKADIDLQSNRVSKSRDVRRSANVRFVLQQDTALTTRLGREQSPVHRPDRKEEAVRMMRQNLAERVLVVGGSGFLGSHLCNDLRESSIDISLLSRDATSTPETSAFRAPAPRRHFAARCRDRSHLQSRLLGTGRGHRSAEPRQSRGGRMRVLTISLTRRHHRADHHGRERSSPSFWRNARFSSSVR